MFCAQVFGSAVFILHFLRGLIGVLGQARVFLAGVCGWFASYCNRNKKCQTGFLEFCCFCENYGCIFSDGAADFKIGFYFCKKKECTRQFCRKENFLIITDIFQEKTQTTQTQADACTARRSRSLRSRAAAAAALELSLNLS